MNRSGRDPSTVAVIVGDDAPLLEAAVPMRVFGVDITDRGYAPYRVVVTGESRNVASTAGVRLALPSPLAAVAEAGTVVIPGWRIPGAAPASRAVIAAIRTAYDEGATVVGLCLGAFVLADAGVLGGRRATTHWHFTDELARYPDVEVDPDVLYVDEGRIITSAGSVAGVDACLHLLRRERGADAAAAVARVLVTAPHRAGGQAQFVEQPIPRVPEDTGIAATAEHAIANLHDPALDVDALARRALMSRRSFDRHFRAATGESPLQWLIRQRVLRAQHLLEVTDLPADAVARAVGFGDAMSLRLHFRRVVGVPPREYRQAFKAS